MTEDEELLELIESLAALVEAEDYQPADEERREVAARHEVGMRAICELDIVGQVDESAAGRTEDVDGNPSNYS